MQHGGAFEGTDDVCAFEGTDASTDEPREHEVPDVVPHQDEVPDHVPDEVPDGLPERAPDGVPDVVPGPVSTVLAMRRRSVAWKMPVTLVTWEAGQMPSRSQAGSILLLYILSLVVK